MAIKSTQNFEGYLKVPKASLHCVSREEGAADQLFATRRIEGPRAVSAAAMTTVSPLQSEITVLSVRQTSLEDRRNSLCMLFTAVGVVCVVAMALGMCLGAPLPLLYLLPMLGPAGAVLVVDYQLNRLREKLSELCVLKVKEPQDQGLLEWFKEGMHLSEAERRNRERVFNAYHGRGEESSSHKKFKIVVSKPQ